MFIVDQSTHVYRKIDVIGTATPPAISKPSSFALAALSLLPLGFIGRRRGRR